MKLAGNASIGAPRAWTLRGPAPALGNPNTAILDLSGHTLTKYNNAFFGIVNADVTDGTIIVNGGTVDFESTTNVHDFGSGDQIIFNNSSTPFLHNEAADITRPMVFNGDTNIRFDNNNSNLLGSNISLNGNLTVQPTTDSTGSVSLNGNITETGGSRSITKAAGTANNNWLLVLGGNNNFTGGVNVQAGTLQLGSSNALNPATPQTVSLNNTSGLRLAGNSVTVGGLTGSNTTAVENASATPATITLANSGDQNYDGIIRDGAGGGAEPDQVREQQHLHPQQHQHVHRCHDHQRRNSATLQQRRTLTEFNNHWNFERKLHLQPQ